jgi:hypothetical protein
VINKSASEVSLTQKMPFIRAFQPTISANSEPYSKQGPGDSGGRIGQQKTEVQNLISLSN